MTLPWADQTESDFLHEQDAAERAAHLKLVHAATAGGEEASDAEVQRLAVDFADTTDACNFILARYAATSKKFYDPSKRVRDFLCAVIGATSGSPEYVPVTDEDLAARMGCSTKTLQNARSEFRSWPDHGKLLGIKDNYREPVEEGGASHPHSYKCRLTLMSAAAAADARLGSGERDEAIKEAARVEADSVAGFVNRPPKRRRKPTDSEMVVRETDQAANSLMRAVNRQGLARNVDFEKLAQARQKLAEALAAFDEAYGFHAEVSTQKKEEEQLETPPPATADVPPSERRMEADSGGGGTPQVEIFSTHSDPTESTTYDFGESEPRPEYDLSEWVWIEGGEVDWKYPPPGNPDLDAAIDREVERLKRGLGTWAAVEGRLGKGGATMRQVDARLALVRNACAGEAPPPRVSPLQRRASQAERLKTWLDANYPITNEAREEYAYVLAERVSVYVYEGLPERCGSKVYQGGECCAAHLALDDIGCLEFWAFPKGEDFPRFKILVSALAGHCTRCESVGHVASACPFPVGDADVNHVARMRRERRARREEAA